MNTDPLLAVSGAQHLPGAWRTEVESQLSGNEEILAWMEVDLDARLHFSPGLLLVTNHRILARLPDEMAWQDWPFRAGLALLQADHAGVGTLELHDDH
ncbi:MAG: ABC transporter, partial [Sulfurimicrobium sp.]|nr:ABC transporter [Sulfurimicrobium sp.]